MKISKDIIELSRKELHHKPKMIARGTPEHWTKNSGRGYLIGGQEIELTLDELDAFLDSERDNPEALQDPELADLIFRAYQEDLLVSVARDQVVSVLAEDNLHLARLFRAFMDLNSGKNPSEMDTIERQGVTCYSVHSVAPNTYIGFGDDAFVRYRTGNHEKMDYLTPDDFFTYTFEMECDLIDSNTNSELIIDGFNGGYFREPLDESYEKWDLIASKPASDMQIEEALNHSDEELGLLALLIQKGIRHPRISQGLNRALNTPQGWERACAVDQCLEYLDGARLVGILIDCLTDEDENVRRIATACYYQRISISELSPARPLFDVVRNDESALVRKNAAWVLSSYVYHDEESEEVRALLDDVRKNDPDEGVRSQAAHSLKLD